MTAPEMVAIWKRFQSLTPTEQRVIAVIGEGFYEVTAIARELEVGYETAKSHLYSIYQKTGIHTLVQLAPVAYLYHLLKDEKVARHEGKPLSAILTRREIKIASLIADGHSNQKIADTLAIDIKTVKRHNSKILASLGFTHRAEVAVRVIHERLSIAQQQYSPASS